MLRFTVFALAAISLAAAVSMPYTTTTADMGFLVKQKKIYDIFMYMSQDVLPDNECYDIGRRYEIASNMDYYTNKDTVMEFLDYYKMGMLRKDATCTYYNPEHRYEMILLYRLMYFAKDFTTFYKTACWARMYMNMYIFAPAFTAALLYRDDTKLIRLPAVYEIYPNAFFDSKTIREAQNIAMTRGATGLGRQIRRTDRDMSETVETYHLYSNFTNCCSGYNNQLSYFTEDVGLNSYYYYCRTMMPFWLSTKDYNMPKEMRGDMYFYIHQQIMARYYLERMSNKLGEMEDFTWDRMNLPGFYGDMTFANGVSMPKRDWWHVVPMYKQRYLETLKRMEYRIRNAIDSGYVTDRTGKQVNIMTPEGLNILGNIVEGNYDSINMKYYGSYDALARNILGANMDVMDTQYYVPSALQLFGSSMRDPAFYRIYDRIVQFYLRYKSLMKRYTKNELEFPGVKIENMEVDKLVTYFETKDFLINNAVKVPTMKEGMSFNIKTWKYYLNYKPFTYKMAITSDKSTESVVRIFLGPAGDKYNDYAYSYKYFFMLDEFEVSLREGMNNIERKSTDSMLFKKEYITGDKYYRKIVQAMQSKEPMTVSERIWGFPEHLYLPKGSVNGMRYKLFCYIGPKEMSKVIDLPIIGKRMWYGKSLGFPLDRPMYPWFTKLSNVYLKDVYIYNIPEPNMMMSGTNMMMNYRDMMMMRGINDYGMTMKSMKDTTMMKEDTMRMTDTGRMDYTRDFKMMNI